LGFIPLVGAAAAAATEPRSDLYAPTPPKGVLFYCRTQYSTAVALNAIDEVVQLGGAALFAVGAVMRHRLRVAEARSRPSSFLLLPRAGPTGFGLSLMGVY
jgi:hypothetical protein